MDINIFDLIDDARCFVAVRKYRWPEKVCCPKCNHSEEIIKRGMDNKCPAKQRYECKRCHSRFDDLTDCIFSGHHQPLKTWIIFLYFLGLNLSTEQIAKELNLNNSDAHEMAAAFRKEVCEKKPQEQLSGEVECDEVYVVAGHKGNPSAVKKKRGKDAETA